MNNSYSFPEQIPIPCAVTVRHMTPVYHLHQKEGEKLEEWDDFQDDEITAKNQKRRLQNGSNSSHNRRLFPSFDSFLPIRIDIVVPFNQLYPILFPTAVDMKNISERMDEPTSWVVLASYLNENNTLSACNVTWDHLDESLYDAIEQLRYKDGRLFSYLHTESNVLNSIEFEEDPSRWIQQTWSALYPHLWVRVCVSKYGRASSGYNIHIETEQIISEDEYNVNSAIMCDLSSSSIVMEESDVNRTKDAGRSSNGHNDDAMRQLCVAPLYPFNLCNASDALSSYAKSMITLQEEDESSRTEDLTIYSSWTLPDIMISHNSIFILYSDGVTRTRLDSSCYFPMGQNLTETSRFMKTYPRDENACTNASNGFSSLSIRSPIILSDPELNLCDIKSLLSFRPDTRGEVEDKSLHVCTNIKGEKHGVDDDENNFLIRTEMKLLESILEQEQQMYNEEKKLLQTTCHTLQTARLQTDKIQEKIKELQSHIVRLRYDSIATAMFFMFIGPKHYTDIPS